MLSRICAIGMDSFVREKKEIYERQSLKHMKNEESIKTYGNGMPNTQYGWELNSGIILISMCWGVAEMMMIMAHTVLCHAVTY